jgi:hypothetical protein
MTGIPPDARGPMLGDGPEAARTAFLRQLAEQDFVPTAALLQAYRTSAGRVLAGAEEAGGEAAAALENGLRDEVEEFAAQFFTLALADRQRRWEALTARCENYATLDARLRSLESALSLDVGVPAGESPQVAQLAAFLGELFTLRPANRAAWRQHMLAEIQQPPARTEPRRKKQNLMLAEAHLGMAAWETAARRLKQKYPALARLDPPLVQRLADWSASRQLLAQARSRRRQPSQAPTSKLDAFIFYSIIAAISIVLRVAFIGHDSAAPLPKPPREFKLPQVHSSPPWEKKDVGNENLPGRTRPVWKNGRIEIEPDPSPPLFLPADKEKAFPP